MPTGNLCQFLTVADRISHANSKSKYLSLSFVPVALIRAHLLGFKGHSTLPVIATGTVNNNLSILLSSIKQLYISSGRGS